MVPEKIDQVLPDLRNTLINLSKLNSVTPPSDTRNIVSYSKELLSGIPGVEIQTIEEVSPIDNLVAHTKGHQPGKHLLLNGHSFGSQSLHVEWRSHLNVGWRRRGRRQTRHSISFRKHAGTQKCRRLSDCRCRQFALNSLWRKGTVSFQNECKRDSGSRRTFT